MVAAAELSWINLADFQEQIAGERLNNFTLIDYEFDMKRRCVIDFTEPD